MFQTYYFYNAEDSFSKSPYNVDRNTEDITNRPALNISGTPPSPPQSSHNPYYNWQQHTCTKIDSGFPSLLSLFRQNTTLISFSSFLALTPLYPCIASLAFLSEHCVSVILSFSPLPLSTYCLFLPGKWPLRLFSRPSQIVAGFLPL